MKILQVNVVYKKGSTGKIVYDIHNELKNAGISSVVCYGRGAVVKEENVRKICNEFYSKMNHFFAKVRGVLYGGCSFSTAKLIRIIKTEKPDVVHLHCLNGYFVNIYKLINWLKRNQIKTVLTLHAEFMHTGGCSHAFDCEQWSNSTGCGQIKCPQYRSDMESWVFDRSRTMWRKMKKAFDGFDNDLIVASVSPWLKSRAERSPILAKKKHCVVLNGVDTAIFRPYDCASATQLKKELGIGEEKVVFHVTPSFSDDKNHIKGGYYIIELAKRLPDVKFVIAGLPKKGITVPPNIILLNKVTDQEKLAKLYSMADLTVLTSKKETFSMVVAESLCCGTPVLGFKASGPESIALKNFSGFVAYGDIPALTKIVKKSLEKCADKSELNIVSSIYGKKNMIESYINIYRLMMECGG